MAVCDPLGLTVIARRRVALEPGRDSAAPSRSADRTARRNPAVRDAVYHRLPASPPHLYLQVPHVLPAHRGAREAARHAGRAETVNITLKHRTVIVNEEIASSVVGIAQSSHQKRSHLMKGGRECAWLR